MYRISKKKICTKKHFSLYYFQYSNLHIIPSHIICIFSNFLLFLSFRLLQILLYNLELRKLPPSACVLVSACGPLADGPV